MGTILNSIKKSFKEVKKDILDTNNRLSNLEKELGVLNGKLSVIENWSKK